MLLAGIPLSDVPKILLLSSHSVMSQRCYLLVFLSVMFQRYYFCPCTQLCPKDATFVLTLSDVLKVLLAGIPLSDVPKILLLSLHSVMSQRCYLLVFLSVMFQRCYFCPCTQWYLKDATFVLTLSDVAKMLLAGIPLSDVPKILLLSAHSVMSQICYFVLTLSDVPKMLLASIPLSDVPKMLLLSSHSVMSQRYYLLVFLSVMSQRYYFCPHTQ